jgi:N12 class adenine-specific DNA methylase
MPVVKGNGHLYQVTKEEVPQILKDIPGSKVSLWNDSHTTPSPRPVQPHQQGNENYQIRIANPGIVNTGKGQVYRQSNPRPQRSVARTNQPVVDTPQIQPVQQSGPTPQVQQASPSDLSAPQATTPTAQQSDFNISYNANQNGKPVTVTANPILPNGEVMPQEDLDNYINGLNGSDDLKSADNLGIIQSIQPQDETPQALQQPQPITPPAPIAQTDPLANFKSLTGEEAENEMQPKVTVGGQPADPALTPIEDQNNGLGQKLANVTGADAPTNEQLLNNQINTLQQRANQAQNLYVQAALKDEIQKLQDQALQLSAARSKYQEENNPWAFKNYGPTAGTSDKQLQDIDPEYAKAQATIDKLNEVQNTIKQANREEEGTGVVKNILHGLWNTISSNYFLSNGEMQQADDNQMVNEAVQRYKQGNATYADHLLLTAAAVESAVNQQYGNKIGMAYNAGQTTAQSLSFMTDFLLNPAEGVGESTTKGLAKYAIKRFGGRTILGKVARVSSRLAGDVVKALGVQTIWGAARTAADAQQRMTGNVLTKIDQHGYTQFDGTEGGDDTSTAIKKAVVNEFINDYSEMCGEYFAPIGNKIKQVAGKAAMSTIGKKLALNKVADFLTKASASDFSKAISNFEQHAHWNGMLGEYGEEVVGNAMNAATIGDQSWSDVVNSKQNLNTFLSVALMSGFFSAVHSVGYFTGRRQARNLLSKTDMNGLNTLGDEWKDYKDQIDGTEIESINGLGEQFKNNPDLSKEQKRALLAYIGAKTFANGYNIGDLKKKTEGHLDSDQAKQEASYDEGLTTTDPREKSQATLKLKAISQQIDTDKLDAMPGTPAQKIQALKDNGTSQEQIQAATDYYNTLAQYTGNTHSAQDNIEQAILYNTQRINGITHTDGNIYQATDKSGNTVNVVTGDPTQSESVVVKDQDGNIQMVPRTDINVDATLNPEQLKQQTNSDIYNQLSQQYADEMNGKIEFTPGTQCSIEINGQPMNIQVAQVSPDGIVFTDGQKSYVSTADQLNEYANDKAISDIKAQNDVQAQQIQQQSQLSTHDYWRNKAGENVTVNGKQYTVEPQNESVEAKNKNGQYEPAYILRDEDGKMLDDAPQTPDKLADMVNQQPTDQSTTNQQPAPTNNNPQRPIPTNDGQQQVKQPQTPVDEEGTPLFHKMTNEQVTDYFKNNGFTTEDAKDYLEDSLANAEKELVKLQKSKPKFDKNPVNYLQNKNELAQQIEEARQKITALRSNLTQMDPLDANWNTKAVTNDSSAIQSKWNNAPKVEGANDEVILPNGEHVKGHYVLTEADAPTPSHDINRNFAKSENFPTDENGNTINDRDYEHDKEAQLLVRQRAQNFDSRALQTPVIVSKNGIVLSGNDRTMSGQLAAENGTDQAYTDYLKEHPEKYGLTNEDVSKFKNPRVVFVPDEEMPYNAKTFAKFNGEEKKLQNKTEKIVKASKTINPEAVSTISSLLDEKENLSDVYSDPALCNQIKNLLIRHGVITENEIPEWFDNGRLSAVGKDNLENILLGSALDEDAIRRIQDMPEIRQPVLKAIMQITANKALGDYSLKDEISQAIKLLHEARRDTTKRGDTVDDYMRQQNMFGNNPTDLYNATVQMLANAMNKGQRFFKDFMESYNNQAKPASQGQLELMTGDVKPKDEIIKDILKSQGYEQGTRTTEQTERSNERQIHNDEQSVSGSNEDSSGEEKPNEQQITEVRKDVDTNPTDAQKEAGNYKKGHVKIDGMDVSIENPKGSTRNGKDADGKEWHTEMNNDYGYIRGTKGVDGDHVDVYFSEHPDNGNVYVVDQVNPKTGEFDEHKVMYGFDSEEDARKAYLSNYQKGWKGLGKITEVSKDDFKKWLDSSTRKTKPFADYKSVPQYGASNKMVTNEKYDELKKKMRDKLNQLNSGFDPELFSIGMQMAAYHIEAGAHKFVDFAKKMIEDVGDKVVPYLKTFYEGYRKWPDSDKELISKMSSMDEVDKFDENSLLPQEENAQVPEENVKEPEENTKVEEQPKEENTNLEPKEDANTRAAKIKAKMQQPRQVSEPDLFNQNINDNGQRSEASPTVDKRQSNGVGTDEARTNGGVQSERTEGTSAERTTERKSTSDGRESNGRKGDNGEVGRLRSDNDRGQSETGTNKPVSEIEKATEEQKPNTTNQKNNPLNTRNYVCPTNAVDVDNYTPAKRMEANVSALDALLNLIKENRDATPEERAILGNFRGWGGLKMPPMFTTDDLKNNRNRSIIRLGEIIDVLDPDGKLGVLDSIKAASLTSYYTPVKIAQAINGFLSRAGFTDGTLLDPSMGTGVFEGTLPKDIQENTQLHGIEMDYLTGQIAKHLYPDARVLISPYQEAHTPKGAYDVVMSNIPFGSIKVYDSSWKGDSSPVKKAASTKVHSYYVVKMLENTKPGGLCVILTSTSILDTHGNSIIREHMLDQAEMLGAIRLPNNTFKGAGTKVTTDVIFLRKFRDGEDRQTTLNNERYKENVVTPLGEYHTIYGEDEDEEQQPVTINGYYEKHPDMMLGEPAIGGMYRGNEFTLNSDMSTDEIASKVNSLIEKKILPNVIDTHKTAKQVNENVKTVYTAKDDERSGNMVVKDGKVGIVSKDETGNTIVDFDAAKGLKKDIERVKTIIPVRSAVHQLITDQISGESKEVLDDDRKQLQNTYDSFVNKFGLLSDKSNKFIDSDIDSYTLKSLEKYKNGKFVGLSDIFTKDTINPQTDFSNITDPKSAVAASLSEYGKVEPAFMQKLLGNKWVELSGDRIFRIPFSDRYVTREEYLSGDVKSKLEDAKNAAAQNPIYESNVIELKAVQPKDIPYSDISIQMGVRWVPADMYTEFMKDTFGIDEDSDSGVRYSPEADMFTVDMQRYETGGEANKWGTGRKSPKEIFEAALEDKTIVVKDKYKDVEGEHSVINKEETDLANNKVSDLRTEFEDWLSRNPRRADELAAIYNDKFNRNVLRSYDGSMMQTPGLQGMTLRPHQKDAVLMLINNQGGIIDHIVGAGKTLVMQSAIMEMRRMGIAKKPMIIALKATVGQIAKSFKDAYPGASILAPDAKDFAKENRKKLLSNIALNDYDCVILSHDQYCMLPHDADADAEVIKEQLQQIESGISALYGADDKSQLTQRQIKGLEKRKQNLQAKLEKLLDRKVDKEFTFEKMGIDQLFVDECQAFKSLPYTTKYQNVAGLGSAEGSQKSLSLLSGIRYLQRLHQGDKGTTFLSGTTISNSLVEIYNLLQYLRPNEMAKLGLNTFDAWASTFAQRSSELEYGVTNQLKEKNRFRSFNNVSELSSMYREMADVRNDFNLKLPKPEGVSHITTIEPSDAMKEINEEIINMVNNKNGSYFGINGTRESPWGLLASNLSSKAAISPKLIDPTLDDEGGKTEAVAEKVKQIYDKFDKQKGTQLIFLDSGIHHSGDVYDAYTDIINRLTALGIPREQIVDIHAADSEKKRKELFDKVNNGDVRVLIGGTKNMGTGVNVQKRIVAMHHVDVPWTPADREQREGRGVRQGNDVAKDYNNNKVDIYFYATKGSLDMYKYQLQDTKGKMFTQFKTGTAGAREFDEGSGDSEEGFNPAEIVAVLSGNPVIFEKSKMDKQVEKLRRMKRAYEADWGRRKQQYEDATDGVNRMRHLVELNKGDNDILEQNKFVHNSDNVYPANVTVSAKGNDVSFDKPKEAGAYIHSLLKSGKDVILKGFGMTAHIGLPDINGKRQIELDAPSGIRYATDLSEDDTHAGSAFRTTLQKVVNNKSVYDKALNDYQKKTEGGDPGENIFPKQKELDESLGKQKELDEEYNSLSKPQNNNDTNRYRNADNVAKEAVDQIEPKVKELSESLHTDVNQVTNDDNLTPEQKNAKGWFDTKTGKVTVNMNNADSPEDVQKTILHEVAGHFGLRNLLGKHFEKFINSVWGNDKIRNEIVESYRKSGGDFTKFDLSKETEEYLARMAENVKDYNAWHSICDSFRAAIAEAKVKLGFRLSDNDVRSIVQASYAKLKDDKIDLKYTPDERILYRGKDARTVERDAATDMYEHIVRQKLFRYFNEAFVDNMKSVKVLMDSILKTRGEEGKLQEWEDPYKAKFLESSINKDESEQYESKYLNPMYDEIARMMKDTGMSYNQVAQYVIEKHGLERNIIQSFRDAIEYEREKEHTELRSHKESTKEEFDKVDNYFNNKYDEFYAYRDELEKSDKDIFEKQDALKEYAQESISGFDKQYRDRSGLSALFAKENEEDDNKTYWELPARTAVSDIEKSYDTKQLWSIINTATKQTLNKAFKSGKITKRTYDITKRMFMNYVPLRGVNGDVASDVYDYINDRPMNYAIGTVKTARGRVSLADDPFATISAMGTRTISDGNRNLINQKLYNFALNHPSKLLSVDRMWYINEGTESNPKWVASYPDIPEDATPEEAAQRRNEWHANMLDKEKEGTALQNPNPLFISYQATNHEKAQHDIPVRVNGKAYTIHVNGDPRAAQALNGLLVNKGDSVPHRVLRWIMRNMASFFTTKNPAFVARNLSKDMEFASQAVFIKEGGMYWRKWIDNAMKGGLSQTAGFLTFGKAGGHNQMTSLMNKYLNDRLDTNNEMERYFKEFMDNGGETGYTNINTIDDYKNWGDKQIKKLTRNNTKDIVGGKIVDAWNGIGKAVEFANRCAEDVTRFNTYLTSRQMGRTIEQSATDAKNVTVNFNRKGSGAGVAGWLQDTMLFFNAGVQSLKLQKELWDANKYRFMLAKTGTVALGACMPILCKAIIQGMGSGDDNDYENIPSWIRQNDVVLTLPNGNSLSFPLSIEDRPFYALGETLYHILNHTYNKTPGEAALDITGMFTDLLPVNFMQGSNSASLGTLGTSLVPDMLKPLYQTYFTNRDYFGRPIHKEGFNSNDPEYTKVFSGTNKKLVYVCKVLNSATGGNAHSGGWLDLNPANIEHIFTGYFGGTFETINQAMKTVLMFNDPSQRQIRNIPIISSFLQSPSDDVNQFSAVNDRFYDIKDKMDKVKNQVNGFRRDERKGVVDSANELTKITMTKDYQMYVVYQQWEKQLNKDAKLLKESTDDADKKVNELNYNMDKAGFIKDIDKIK